MERKKLTIPFNRKLDLEVEIDESNDITPEIIICLREKDTGLIHQDIALVRKHWELYGDINVSDTAVDVIVWANENSEDYTDKFTIPMYKE